MKKYTLSAILFAATLFSCGTESSGTKGSSESNVDAVTTELTYSVSGEEQQMSNIIGEVVENRGKAVLTFEGGSGKVEIYISTEKLKVQEYEMDLDDLSTKDVLASYAIKLNDETGYCCGIVGEERSSGSIIITEIGGNVVNGKMDILGYDGSFVKGEFSAIVKK